MRAQSIADLPGKEMRIVAGSCLAFSFFFSEVAVVLVESVFGGVDTIHISTDDQPGTNGVVWTKQKIH